MKEFKKGDVITLRAEVTDAELGGQGILIRHFVDQLRVVTAERNNQVLDIRGENARGAIFWVSSEWYDKSND